MKYFTPSKFILNLTLLLSFKFILNGPCYFKKTKDGQRLDTDNQNYLNGINNTTEAKQMCFSLSHSEDQTDKCCYLSSKCVNEHTDDSNEECPQATNIANNCGMAGVYQPLTKEICTEISLVQGYCCYIKTKSKGTACIRTKELNKDKNTATDQMKQYIQDNNVNPDEIDFVLCKGNYIKYYWIFINFAVIFLK